MIEGLIRPDALTRSGQINPLASLLNIMKTLPASHVGGQKHSPPRGTWQAFAPSRLAEAYGVARVRLCVKFLSHMLVCCAITNKI